MPDLRFVSSIATPFVSRRDMTVITDKFSISSKIELFMRVVNMIVHGRREEAPDHETHSQ
jgi:hypothetical protein